MRGGRVRFKRPDGTPHTPIPNLPTLTHSIERAMQLTHATLAEKPDLADTFQKIGDPAWPAFILHGDASSWSSVYDAFAAYQLALLDESGTVVGIGHTAPLCWDGTPDDLPDGIEAILQRGLHMQREGKSPDTLSALAAVVPPEHQRQGHSARILLAMRKLAAARGIKRLIAPVRPILKAAYPLQPLERYAAWTREDGKPFDPWIRVHWDLGARPLKVAPRGMTVEGSVAEWQQWTGMSFPESGAYVVPGALQPVEIDTAADRGLYYDPNYWMQHPVD